MAQQPNTVALPKQKLMRKNALGLQNPMVIKSGQDGKVYKRTGRTVKAEYVKPTGRVYVAPPKAGQSKSKWSVLEPFAAIMDKHLKKKGKNPPASIEDKAKLFYNEAIAAKAFAGAKPMNFEGYDEADPQVPDTVIPQMLTYFKSLIAGKQPNGQPLSTQDQKLSTDAKIVMQELASKVANAGLSPQDAAALGAQMDNTPPVSAPFYKKPMFKWIAGGVILVIILIIATR